MIPRDVVSKDLTVMPTVVDIWGLNRITKRVLQSAAGAIAGMAAQGLSPFEAASLGVYLHGEAGATVGHILGDAGMIASDLLMALPVVIKQLKENTKSGGG